MEEKPVYIHYGDDEYRTPRLIENSYFRTKPRGGLWASRKNDAFGWKSWCEAENFRLNSFDHYFEFVLKDDAKVLTLVNRDQLDDLPKVNDYYDKDDQLSECYLDFEKIAEEYDAIELLNIEAFYDALIGWDCNSILIMNPDIVEVSHGKS